MIQGGGFRLFITGTDTGGGRTEAVCMKPHRSARTASASLPHADRKENGNVPDPLTETGKLFQGLSHSPDERILDRFGTTVKDLRTGCKIDRYELWACGT